VSHCLTPHQVKTLRSAADAAWQRGLPLNRHVTIHWQRQGVPDGKGAAATGTFLRMVRDWLRKLGQRTAWVWVRENGPAKGAHVHIALHIPAGVPWRFGRARRWIKRISGRRYVARAIRTTRVAGHVNAALVSPDHYAANLAGLLTYMTKGAAGGGVVVGKRCGHSQNLGRAALERRGDTGDNRVNA
jgi:hypothetical protein